MSLNIDKMNSEPWLVKLYAHLDNNVSGPSEMSYNYNKSRICRCWTENTVHKDTIGYLFPLLDPLSMICLKLKPN